MSNVRVLPSMEHTFTVKVKGSETGQMFEGTFTYKRPNIRIRTQINKTAAMLDGGVTTLDDDTKFLHSILARLKHTLMKSPEWWEQADFGFELYDLNVVFEIYKSVEEFEAKWIGEVWEGKEEAKEPKKK
jgi:hypothetical protein